MKAFIVALLALFPVAGWTHENPPAASDLIQKSSVALAATTALELFHESNKGFLWAVDSRLTGDEVTNGILYVDSTKDSWISYSDCHFHQHGSDNEAHCHDGADANSALVAPASFHFSVDEFIVALSSALDILNRKVTPVENLIALKAWQSADQMFFNLSYQSASAAGVSYYMCHVHHGSEIDCHRSLKPGPQEPAY